MNLGTKCRPRLAESVVQVLYLRTSFKVPLSIQLFFPRPNKNSRPLGKMGETCYLEGKPNRTSLQSLKHFLGNFVRMTERWSLLKEGGGSPLSNAWMSQEVSKWLVSGL